MVLVRYFVKKTQINKGLNIEIHDVELFVFGTRFPVANVIQDFGF